jgi:hypothetical protein
MNLKREVTVSYIVIHALFGFFIQRTFAYISEIDNERQQALRSHNKDRDKRSVLGQKVRTQDI